MMDQVIKNGFDSVILSDEASDRMYENIIKKSEIRKAAHRRVRTLVPVAAAVALTAARAVFLGAALRREPGGAEETTSQVTASLTQALSGGDNAGLLFVLSPDAGIVQTGEVLTEAEADAYLKENAVSIKSSLSASGVSTSGFRIGESGYRHISCAEGADAYELKMNCFDYVVYNGDGLAAVITLIRENGRIYSSVSFGSPKYEEFDAYLKAHAGEELVFLYIGHAEVVLSHDSYYTQGDFDVSPLFGEIAMPFEHFRSDEAVYVP